MSDFHRRTSHSPYTPEASEAADRSTSELIMASSVDDERPTGVDVRRLSTFWENRGTIHVVDNNTNQPEAPIPESTPDTTSIEPSSPTNTKKPHFWHINSPPYVASNLPNRPNHERTDSTASESSSQGSGSTTTAVDEKFDGGVRSDKGSAKTSVKEIEDMNNHNIKRPPEEERPYHVFTKKEKWLVTIIIALAGLFSPLSSNIYFPALGAIANVSHHQQHPSP